MSDTKLNTCILSRLCIPKPHPSWHRLDDVAESLVREGFVHGQGLKASRLGLPVRQDGALELGGSTEQEAAELGIPVARQTQKRGWAHNEITRMGSISGPRSKKSECCLLRADHLGQ